MMLIWRDILGSRNFIGLSFYLPVAPCAAVVLIDRSKFTVWPSEVFWARYWSVAGYDFYFSVKPGGPLKSFTPILVILLWRPGTLALVGWFWKLFEIFGASELRPAYGVLKPNLSKFIRIDFKVSASLGMPSSYKMTSCSSPVRFFSKGAYCFRIWSVITCYRFSVMVCWIWIGTYFSTKFSIRA